MRDIVSQVHEEGDVALRRFAEEFDDVSVGNIDVTDAAERAYEELDDDVREAIEDAAANIRAFHERQVPEDWRDDFEGRELGRRFRPLDSAGVYAPGGTAAYPSSALMGVIPAKVAGVEHVAVATPPAEEVNPVTLAAIHVAGADAVYQVGGAQAIAALAYGTETVSATDIVVGPGNRWVTAAKAEVRGDVAIDFLAGPSEVMVVADGDADPELVAADLIAQAEHDENASVVAVTDDADLAEQVVDAVDEQADGREREAVIRAALDNDTSGVLLARSMSEAVLFAEEYAAEHLSIQAATTRRSSTASTPPGASSSGRTAPSRPATTRPGRTTSCRPAATREVTGGLSVDTFVRSTTVQRLSEDSLGDIADTITTLAEPTGDATLRPPPFRAPATPEAAPLINRYGPSVLRAFVRCVGRTTPRLRCCRVTE